MAIGTVGNGLGISPYSYRPKTASKKKADDDGSTKKTADTAEAKGSAKATQEKKVTSKADVTDGTKESGEVYTKGKTIGKPTLSKKAASYYEKLQKKFSGMSFILVSEDEKANAQANAASYGSQKAPVVLINEDKIEQMASDPEYAKKYESIIEQSQTKLPDIQKKLADSVGSNVLKGIGMNVLDNGASSFFAIVSKQGEANAQALKKRQEAKKAAAKAAKKQAEKKADKKEQEEKLKEKAAEKSDDTSDTKEADDDEDFVYEEKNPDSSDKGEVTPWDMYGTQVIYANSVDDLIKAVKSYVSGSDAYSEGNSLDYTG